jgi:hypothetical protein
MQVPHLLQRVNVIWLVRVTHSQSAAPVEEYLTMLGLGHLCTSGVGLLATMRESISSSLVELLFLLSPNKPSRAKSAPNTTGAYELDLAEINNFTAAWRPMHVKTDIFCSASLTLPDKAGRQINIGGWANDATYGIRLYTPSGSPGVAGTTDWQENVNEVALQNGRWYPTSMIMVGLNLTQLGIYG